MFWIVKLVALAALLTTIFNLQADYIDRGALTLVAFGAYILIGCTEHLVDRLAAP